MRIVYTQNPLETVVEIDDMDRKVLRLKLIIELLEENLGEAAFHVGKEHFDLDIVKKAVAWDTWSGEKFEAAINERITLAESELCGSHVGDCTCVPCSCMKCWAEDLLGIKRPSDGRQTPKTGVGQNVDAPGASYRRDPASGRVRHHRELVVFTEQGGRSGGATGGLAGVFQGPGTGSAPYAPGILRSASKLVTDCI